MDKAGKIELRVYIIANRYSLRSQISTSCWRQFRSKLWITVNIYSEVLLMNNLQIKLLSLEFVLLVLLLISINTNIIRMTRI